MKLKQILPFAIALDIEPQWSKQFESELNQIREKTTQYSNLSTINYASFGNGNIGGFSHSMTSSIASSGTSPSSGGSGFSGGSSGGGGGGGW